MFFRNQFANVVEWEEFRDDMIFWKWSNKEIKRGSKLIIRAGQDAIFLHSGRIEGIFKEEGSYDIESQIIPFLSTLKGFKFGFNSGMRAEVLFVNTKEFIVKWGTRNAINIPHPQLPGGLPVRANGTFNVKVSDYIALIDNIAGIKSSYYIEDVRLRITSVLDQLLMKWISKEGKDMFNLQANAFDISSGIREDLDKSLISDGLTITKFTVMSFNYPEEIQKMITKTASHTMIGDLGKYQQVEMVDGMASGKVQGGGAASDMTGMMMGMNIANEMMKNMNQGQGQLNQGHGNRNQDQMNQGQNQNQGQMNQAQGNQNHAQTNQWQGNQNQAQASQGQGNQNHGQTNQWQGNQNEAQASQGQGNQNQAQTNQGHGNENEAQAPQNQQSTPKSRPNFCPNCGTKTGEGNFCSNCGFKLV